MQVIASNSKETLQQYPCEYLFKAFGCSEPAMEFVLAVHAVINEVVPVDVNDIKHRPSSKGAYVCVSVAAYLENEQQRQNIYNALQQLEGLKYLL